MKRIFFAIVFCLMGEVAYGQTSPPDKLKIGFGIDVSFAGIHDNAERGSMGRERQMKIAFFNLSVVGRVTDRISFSLVINPANDQRIPRPYIARPEDRRDYFFPNLPEGRGVVSDPEGLYKVDDYKHTGLDPIIQQGLMRVGYIDLHSRSGKYGLKFGRDYLSQGLMLDDFEWFTAKDLTHIQLINAQADNGIFIYLENRHLSFNADLISGNGNPYHDYGYFDFTDASEDKNSFMGGVIGGRYKSDRFMAGASLKKNIINSRIEDSTTIQLSKHNDNALIVFGSVHPVKGVRIFGERVRYTWGLALTSAQLLRGFRVMSPVIKDGYYLGIDVNGPDTKIGKFSLTYTREELSRDDSLVAWAAANKMFNVVLGKTERSEILKVYNQLGKHLTAFFFINRLSNPFPELSAIKPISGPGSGFKTDGRKIGLGVRVRM